ncbi:MAG: Hsp70 family protein [Pseudomonadota bacterium]
MALSIDRPILCVDFGTTNSAACWVEAGEVTVVPLEEGRPTLPSAIFFSAEDLSVAFGAAAIRRYESGESGRLMKALKTVMSTGLIDESTAIRGGYIRYREVIGLFLAHIKSTAEAFMGRSVDQALLGRPVHFIDDAPERDRRAQEVLGEIANQVGLTTVRFQYEPIAAAVDYEVSLTRDQAVLIVDIGGGTSDFSLVSLGPSFRDAPDRSGSVVGTAGVRLAGTDFDRLLSLETTMRTLGMGATGKSGRPLPTYLYHKLSTWHEINTAYNPADLSETMQLRAEFVDLRMHDRLMCTLREKLGHRLIGAVERAKMEVAEGGEAEIGLAFLEDALIASLGEDTLRASIGRAITDIVGCAEQLIERSALARDAISALYFTGGSTGVRALREAFAQAFPLSEAYVGEQFTSVSQGLGIAAGRGYWLER